MNFKHFPLKTLLSISPSSSSVSPPLYSLSIFISHFSTSQTHHYHSYYPSRRQDDESRQVKVSVWWDFENCSPSNANVFRIAPMIAAALRANGIKGPIQITAFGDIMQLTRVQQEALSATGINLAHVPSAGKNSADRSLLVDLMYWTTQNPPPAHLLVISGDRDFASTLHRLRMNNYNVLLASPENAPSVLCSAASIMWNWQALLRGENLTGKHYNLPPDGPYGSWYGHDKVPLQDPFLVEAPASSQNDELSEVLKPVPKAVMKHIGQILKSYPEGISMHVLCNELISNVHLDKYFYGYKNFTRFLLSMPHILRLEQPEGGGDFLVRMAPKASESSETSPCSSAGCLSRSEDALPVSSRLNDNRSVGGAPNAMPKLHKSPEVNVGVDPRKVQETPPENDLGKVNAEKPAEEVQQSLPVVEKIAEASDERVTESHQTPILEQDSASDERVTESHQTPILEQDSASEVGSFRKVWQLWFHGSNDNSEVKSHVPEKCGDSEGSSEKIRNNMLKNCAGVSPEREETKEVSEPKSDEGAHTTATSLSSNDLTDNKANLEAGENHSKRSGLFNRIAAWCKSWRSSQDSEESADQSCEKHNHINNISLKHEIFTQDSFWKDMEILLDSPRGLALVTQSMTREEMAEKLRKEGPLALRSVSNCDLLELVDLLISDKKWIEECSSKTSPFRIARAVEKSHVSGNTPAANGLRSIFLRTSSQANLQRKHEGHKKLENVPHSGVSSTIINKNATERSKSEILAHCQKLVKMILKEHPEGYKIGAFRKLFLERYGYPLDIQRLGYKKLSSLLEKIPGVKLESPYIMPASSVPKDSDLETVVPNVQEDSSQALQNSAGVLSDALTKGEDPESAWDELGPVSCTSSNKNEMQSVFGIGSKTTEDAEIACFNYEPSISDDEFSDSEGELSTPEQRGKQQKPTIVEGDSSLFQILDSWYSSKEGEDNPEKSEDMVDCLEATQVNPSDAAGVDVNEEASLEDHGQKQRLHKTYSFVADPVAVGDDKGKLISGILGNLEKRKKRRKKSKSVEDAGVDSLTMQRK
ncbi:hypothetical protein CCACVL1_01521 [Corchorus capsularis]|uniref:HTH OST-type domain-containing protein n=1 Tax=Corchorus capsularis TaxID=210143 RepID=A0A1R3KHG2_COCAP|nr:hypothetical protein CCACVL1_01521 [Corchorus capsularis]